MRRKRTNLASTSVSLQIASFAMYKSSGRRHWLSDCHFFTDEEKADTPNRNTTETSKTIPTKCERSQLSAKSTDSKFRPSDNKITWPLANKDNTSNTPTFIGTFMADHEKLVAKGCTENGSNEPFMSVLVAGWAVLNKIGKQTCIKNVTMLLALQMDGMAQQFRFLERHTLPRTAPNQSAGPLALLKLPIL